MFCISGLNLVILAWLGDELSSGQDILPILWKVRFLYNIEIARALRVKSSYIFLNAPQVFDEYMHPLSISLQRKERNVKLLHCWAPQILLLSILRPQQNDHHFAADTFKYVIVKEHVWIVSKISLKFVAKGLTACQHCFHCSWCWRGSKP